MTEDLDLDHSTEDYAEMAEKLVETGYGKKMDDSPREAARLMSAVETVLEMDYDEFSSDTGQEVLSEALYAAEEAPEATLDDDIRRLTRVSEIPKLPEIDLEFADEYVDEDVFKVGEDLGDFDDPDFDYRQIE